MASSIVVNNLKNIGKLGFAFILSSAASSNLKEVGTTTIQTLVKDSKFLFNTWRENKSFRALFKNL